MAPLYESTTVIADAAGKAIARLQPMRAFERWHVTRVTVSSTSSVKIPTIKEYLGAENPSAMIDNSYNGQLNHSDCDIHVPNGTPLLMVWENGDVGARCVYTIEGERLGR